MKRSSNSSYRYILNYKNINVSYNYIPKNACTSIKKTLGVANGTLTIDQTPHGKENPNISYCITPHFNSVKLIVYRNPFKRIVSAFLDKISNPKKNVGLDVCETIFKNQRNIENENENDIKNLIDSKNTPTFLEFMQYVSMRDDNNLNEHWRSQCSLSLFDEYDLIFSFENLNNEWNNSILGKYPIIKHDKHTTNYGGDTSCDYNPFWDEDIALLPGALIVDRLKKLQISIDKNVFYKNDEVKELFINRFADDIYIYRHFFPELAEKEFGGLCINT
jgi:hypothetical protein